MARLERWGERLRENGVAVGAALVLAALVGLAARWVARSREAPAQKRVLTITGVLVRPEPPPQRPPPPPPVKDQLKVEEQPRNRLVEVKATDIPPPDAPRPSAPSGGPAAGPLALATEATGEGDAFNLAGNPGGRGLLGPGGIGDGTGEGIGGGGDDSGRYAWYFTRIGADLEESFRRLKKASTAQVRVEFKIWWDPSGRITRVQLLRSTGSEELDRVVQSVVGLKLREPPPPDVPMPVTYRFTARRPG